MKESSTGAHMRIRDASSTGVHEGTGLARSAGTGPPAPLLMTRALVARRPIVAFLILTYVLGWAIQIGAFQLGLPAMPSLRAGSVLGLLMPAVLVTAAVSSLGSGRTHGMINNTDLHSGNHTTYRDFISLIDAISRHD